MRYILIVLMMCAPLLVDAQQYQLVIHREGRTPMRIDICDIDSMTIEEKATENHEYVDLGLSVLWATCNIGAEMPEQYGHYFAWGETEPKETYTADNYQHATNNGYVWLGNDIARSNYDTAYLCWQGEWRMPTIQEAEELGKKCTWTWTSVNGINGYKVTGPSGNHIFLPAAGQMREQNLNQGATGYYWTSTQSEEYSSAAYNLNFTGYDGRWSANRAYGFSIRPVMDK